MNEVMQRPDAHAQGRPGRRLRDIARDRLAERRAHRTLGSWLWSLYDRALRRWRRAPLPGRGRVVRAQPRALSEPVYLRLGGSDFAVLQELCPAREGEYDVVKGLSLGDEPYIVDLGANVGLSVRLWREWFPRARVLAVEPDPDNFALIKRNNADAGRLGEEEATVALARVCVAAQEGEVQLIRSNLPWAFHMSRDVVNSGGSLKTQAITMEKLLEEADAPGTVDLLKCDIEGAERELFESCRGWIHRVRFFVVETHDGWGAEDLAAALRRAGVEAELDVLRKVGSNQLVLGRLRGRRPAG